jgi:hypothetical protein
MALNEALLSNLMLVTFGVITPGSKTEFDCYAEGIVAGLKAGIVTIQTTGLAGSPGSGVGIGAIQGGPLVMLPLVATNSIGIIPPIPEGAPTPLQPLWYLAISQTATHVLSMLQVDSVPADAVAAGIGIVAPGGFQISGALISSFIVLAYLKRGLTPTPRRIQVASLIGKSVQQMMLLATCIIPIAGGAPVAPPAPGVGVRTGIIS